MVIPLQLLLTDPLNLRLFSFPQPLPHRLIHLDDPQSPGVPEHLHILEPPEGVGQDIPLGLAVALLV